MNKLFDFHLIGEETNRPYYLGAWEPIEVDAFRLPPFQIKTNSSDYSITQVTQTSDYDFTSLMNGVTYHNGYLTYDGSILDNKINNGICYFVVESGGEKYYSDQCDVCNVSNWLKNFSVIQEDCEVTNLDDIYILGEGVNDGLIRSNILYLTAGEDITFIFIMSNYLNIGNKIYYQDGTFDTISHTLINGFNTFTYTCTKSGNYYLDLFVNPVNGKQYITFARAYKTYSSDKVKISISSTVDYADIYYKGGFTQELYRLANVRRSPEPKITVIGEERNGVIVREKVITATRYKCVMKINEAMLNALTTSVGANVTITDQTGHEFTCNNLEIDKPTWYNSNGIVTLTFDDNINVFTQTQPDL